MASNETTRRRRVQGRSSRTSEFSSISESGRSGLGNGLQQHRHHHDHHHHHYHYHHHYHHFPRSLNADQDQALLVSTGGISTSAESSSQGDTMYSDRQGLVYRRNSLQSAARPREATNEVRERLDERRRSPAMQNHRPGFRSNLLEEFSLLFEDDEDRWSDDELLELGIHEWLAAAGYEAFHRDIQSVPEQGLSKAIIRQLPKVVYVPQALREDGRVGSIPSDQEDCCVCLEHFLVGQQLICLPCNHKFHPNCLSPWLENHAKCPYCRAKVRFEEAGASSSSQSGNDSSSSLMEDDLIAWMEAVDSELSHLSIR